MFEQVPKTFLFIVTETLNFDNSPLKKRGLQPFKYFNYFNVPLPVTFYGRSCKQYKSHS